MFSPSSGQLISHQVGLQNKFLNFDVRRLTSGLFYDNSTELDEANSQRQCGVPKRSQRGPKEAPGGGLSFVRVDCAMHLNILSQHWFIVLNFSTHTKVPLILHHRLLKSLQLMLHNRHSKSLPLVLPPSAEVHTPLVLHHRLLRSLPQFVTSPSAEVFTPGVT